jgi:very-short-patch-repair endonuclease
MPISSPTLQRKRGEIDLERVAPSLEATYAIRDLAERQHGVVARRQLLNLHLGIDLIRARVESGRLVPLHHGVFALGHGRLTRRGEWMAAVLACGPGAVLSHGSAADLWGIRGSRGPIEVTRVSGHRRPHGVRLHQTRWLPPEQRVIEAGIPVTSLERVMLDIAGGLDDRQLERALVEADRRGLRWAELRRILDATTGRKGQGRLGRLVDEVDPRAVETRSPTEIDFLALCRKARLPLPQVNVLVEGLLVDFLWPGSRVIVETDSYTFHGDRPAFERDHERRFILQAAGYTVHCATYKMLESNPHPFLGLVRRSLGI